jgi:intein-encoded DNA endonuclease-like protein
MNREPESAGENYYATIFRKRVRQFLENHPEFILARKRQFTVKRSPYVVDIPETFNQELSRILGIMHGDGNMSGARMHISDESYGYQKTVIIPLFQDVFGVTLNLYHDHTRNSYYTYTKCRIVYYYLVEVLELPEGAMRPNIRIPSYLAFAPVKLQASYVAGLFDAEAHVRRNQAEIDFYTTTPELVMFVANYLDRTGVKHGFLTRQRQRKREYELIMTGQSNVKQFIDATPLRHPDKLRILHQHFSTD